ncbi:MAG: hypothetical protein ACE5D8_06420 [Fidelibacterota bacterium]
MKHEKQRRQYKVQLVVRHPCRMCDKVQSELEAEAFDFPNIVLEIIDADTAKTYPGNRTPFITPAVWVNERLWFLGGFDIRRFRQKFRVLTYTN